MKTRVIQTKFWDDPFIVKAPTDARLLFMYLLTCSQIGLTGIFEVSVEEVELKSGLKGKKLNEAFSYLESNGKVHLYGTWIKVVNAAKYNNYSNGEKNEIATAKERENIPLKVFTYFESKKESLDTPLEGVFGTPNSAYKSETRKQELEKGVEVLGEGDFSKIENIQNIHVVQVALDHNVPSSFVYSKLDDMRNWRDENPQRNKKKNWLATLKSWVKRDAMNIQKEAHGQSKIAYINTDSGEPENPVQDQTDQRNGRDSGLIGEEQHPQGLGGGGTLHSGQRIYVDGELDSKHRAVI